MDAQTIKEMREYSWNYFIAFADARLSTFRFYLAFCTILIAGIAAIIVTSEKWLAISLSLLLSFLSFIYWKVDVRHKELIKHAEEALEYLEKKIEIPEGESQPHVIQLFLSESVRSKTYKRFPKTFRFDAYFSYSTCVNIVFLLFGLGGIILSFVLLVS